MKKRLIITAIAIAFAFAFITFMNASMLARIEFHKLFSALGAQKWNFEISADKERKELSLWGNATSAEEALIAIKDVVQAIETFLAENPDDRLNDYEISIRWTNPDENITEYFGLTNCFDKYDYFFERWKKLVPSAENELDGFYYLYVCSSLPLSNFAECFPQVKYLDLTNNFDIEGIKNFSNLSVLDFYRPSEDSLYHDLAPMEKAAILSYFPGCIIL